MSCAYLVDTDSNLTETDVMTYVNGSNVNFAEVVVDGVLYADYGYGLGLDVLHSASIGDFLDVGDDLTVGGIIMGSLSCSYLTDNVSDLCSLTDTTIPDTNETDNVMNLLAENITIWTNITNLETSGFTDTNTNCSVLGTCPTMCYLEYENDGNFNVTGNLTVGDVLLVDNTEPLPYGISPSVSIGDGTATLGMSINSSTYGIVSKVQKSDNGLAVQGLTDDGSITGYLVMNTDTFGIGHGWAGGVFAQDNQLVILANETVGIYAKGDKYAGHFEGVTYIDDVLRLEPRSTAPTTVEGAIYADSDSHALCYYNSTHWIDLTGNEGTCS